MDIQATIRLQFIPTIKRRQRSHALLAHSPWDACHLDCAMPRDISMMHDGNLLRLAWWQLGSFHGRLLRLWKRLRQLFGSPNQDLGGLCQETTGVKLGKISFRGERGSSARAYPLGKRTRGGQGQDRGHPKPPSSRYRTRFKELSLARWLLLEIYSRLSESLQATHHPSLQG